MKAYKSVPLFLIVLSLFCVNGCKHSASLSGKPFLISKASAVSEADLGLPLYPGAVIQSNESYVFQKQDQAAGPVHTASISLKTPASVDEVEKFYREKISKRAKITSYFLGSGKLVDIAYEDKSHRTRVQVTPEATGHGSIIVIIAEFG